MLCVLVKADQEKKAVVITDTASLDLYVEFLN